MLVKNSAERALSAAVATGGDFAEIFYEDTKSSSLTMINDQTENATISRAHGAGIRVYKGFQSVYVHTNDTTEQGLIRAAAQAASAIGNETVAADIRLTGSIAANIHPIKIMPMDVSGQKRACVCHSATASAQSVSSDIRQVRVLLMGKESDITIANTDGLFIGDTRVYTRLSVTALASNGSENQTGSSNPGAMMGFELFDTRVDVDKAARDAAKTAVTMLNAEPCRGGVMPVVIDNGFGGVIFHEACGHSLEATSVAIGMSEFSGRLGQKIASEKVTAIDDEGTPTTRLVLIENGVLKNYMIDRLNGRRMGMPVTGSARRQDYTFAPTSRMRNTFIAAGTDEESEIISTAGDALYAKKMGGGSVNPATGEFNFAVQEGYIIRAGQIDRPVRGATLVGKGSEILLKIDRVGRDMKMAQGMCGSRSGSIPTNVGQPMIRVTDITVGGR